MGCTKICPAGKPAAPMMIPGRTLSIGIPSAATAGNKTTALGTAQHASSATIGANGIAASVTSAPTASGMWRVSLSPTSARIERFEG